MDGFKKGGLVHDINGPLLPTYHFKVKGKAIMEMDELSCRAIEIFQEFWNLSCWSWMLLRRNNNARTRIVTAYYPTVSASTRGAYIEQLESLKIMKIQNDPRNQSWIELSTDIAKFMDQVEQIIIMGACNSEASEVNT